MDPSPIDISRSPQGSSPSLVLSGGGTRGAFEAGAVGLLEHEGLLNPPVIAGTSAGSICGAVLAQARTAAEFSHYAAVLRADILAMTEMNRVFSQSQWMAELAGTPLDDTLLDAVTGRGRPQIGADPAIADDPLASSDPARHTAAHSLAASVLHPVRLHRAKQAFWDDPGSLMTLDPLADALRGAAPDGGIEGVDETLVARPGLTLRLTVTPLKAGVPRYVTQDGTMCESDSRTPHDPAGTPGVIEGVLASASVPVVFRPREIGDDVYVDGGVLLNLPVEAAVNAGAGDIVAVSANAIMAPPYTGPLDKPTLVQVTERFATLQFYDQVRRSLRYPLADGATLTPVFPTMEVIAMFEVSPGLLQIDMDYGWLRAAEAIRLPTREQAAAGRISDRIVTGRQRAWHLEHLTRAAEPQLVAVDPRVPRALDSAKTMVADGLTEWRRFGLPLPDGAADWAETDEHHDTS
ncbi:MAG: patatin-like phospholipase family protein [Actinobacteria bacterium]|nr:patatin-like phospholipase family protein [Actinomycetota bacterium]MCB9412213.1 patatin-like phospholipase family protein [Actinomycetota bacterium]